MTYFSEERRKRRERTIAIIVTIAVLLIVALTVAYLRYRSISQKYVETDGVKYVAADAEYELFSQTASSGYVYGSAPVTMYDYFYQMAVDKASRFYSPMNKFLHVKRFAEAGYTSILNVDADTLSSVAWLDISREPSVVYCPDTGGRYYSVEILDFYGNLCGSYHCTPGEVSKRNFLIAPQGYIGTVPSDTQIITATTNYVLCYVKLAVPTGENVDSERNIQAQFDIRPLTLHGSDVAYAGVEPPSSFTKLAVETPLDFYNALSRITALVPPPADDAGMVALLSKIGVAPGGEVSEDMYTKSQLDAIADGYETGRQLVAYTKDKLPQSVGGGFSVINANGIYGGDYYKKGALLKYGIMSYDPANFLYIIARTDGSGDYLEGENAYEITFPAPPETELFWSLTLYRAADGSLVKNAMNVYRISSDTELKKNADGSFTIYVSSQQPVDTTMINNWLPAPEDNFSLALRVYQPGESMLEGSFTYPVIKKVA